MTYFFFQIFSTMYGEPIAIQERDHLFNSMAECIQLVESVKKDIGFGEIYTDTDDGVKIIVYRAVNEDKSQMALAQCRPAS